MQHADGVWEGSYGLGNHSYLIPGEVDLKDAVSFAYGASMQRNVLNKREVLLDEVNLVYFSHKKDAVDYNMLRSSLTVEMTGEGDDNSFITLWPLFSLEA